jgi:hypothetical protein
VCQVLVMEFLEEHKGEWFTVREIWVNMRILFPELDVNLNSTSDNCKQLRKRNQVLYATKRRLVGNCMKDVIVYKFRRL